MNSISFTGRKFNKQDWRELQTAVAHNEVILFDVDTQNAYLSPNIIRLDGTKDGLCLKNPNSVKGNFSRIKNATYGILPKLESGDAHKPGDPVMDEFKHIADIYAEKGTWGAERIPETYFGKPDIIMEVEPEKLDVPTVAQIKDVLDKKGIISIEKNDLSPLTWGNRFTKQLESNPKGIQFFENLKNAGVKFAVVYGVATDYCVKNAVNVLKQFEIKPIVVKDAIKEVSEKSTEIKNHPIFGDIALIKTKSLEKLLKKIK